MINNQNIPLVSVIIPNYNYARYLPERIDSILKQTFQDFELILLDDVSTDDSVSVLKQYSTNEHVSQLVINETNTGSPFKQWARGIGLARGKYVWIAEADDLAEPAFLETCVRYAEQYKDFAIAYTGSLLIDARGRIEYGKDVNRWGKRSRQEATRFDGKDFALHNLYWRNYILNGSGVLFRREYALKVTDAGFTDFHYCGDWLFWFQMALQGSVVEIYRNLNYFRQHDTKVSRSAARSGGGALENIWVVKRMEALLPVGTYKKRLRHGKLYRGIKHSSASREGKAEMKRVLKQELGSGRFDYYFVERANQFLRLLLPRLTTPRRDRL